MKVQQILYSICVIALAMPLIVNAEIYKWKDKNGVTRYSDRPPSGNVKADTLGVKTPVRPKPAAKNVSDPTTQGEVGNENLHERFKEPEDPEAEAARVRARNAEIEKKNKLEKEAQAKIDAENCKGARANYQTYAQGGRIYKTNEKGEREYLGDAELESGKAKAQAEIQEFCK
jgi:Domain of unknown function (DUF4124)